MERVAVTGGAGFIGSNLVARLVDQSFEVVVIDDLSTGLLSNISSNTCEFHEISVCDFKELNSAISECDTIFHFGARGSVPRSINDPVATYEVNSTGTLNVLEVARKSGAHVIFSSSSSVYGRNTKLPKEESMWLGPMTPYAASKLSAEAYVQAYSSSYNMPITILRFFNVFGPRQRPDHQYAAVLPKWIWLAIQNKPIQVFGDGTAFRDFTYVETVLDVALSAMRQKILTEGAINVAFGNRISLNDCIDLLKKHFPNLQVEYVSQRPGDIKESQNSPTLLNSLFPEIKPREFEDALNETITWLKEFGKSITCTPNVAD